MTEILYITQCQTLFRAQTIRTLAGRIPGWVMRGNCRPFIGVFSIPIHVPVPPVIVVPLWTIFGFVTRPIAVMANDSLSMAAVLCVVIWLSTEWAAVCIVTWPVCYTGLLPLIFPWRGAFLKLFMFTECSYLPTVSFLCCGLKFLCL